MMQLTMNKLKQVVTSGLHLEDAHYQLEKSGNRISGHVISPTFRGLEHQERQKRIWDVLEAVLGAEAVTLVGLLLAYTPEEWSFGAGESEDAPPKKKRKTG